MLKKKDVTVTECNESALDFFEEEKNFKQLRQEWLGSQSDNINYCMPVCIGVVAQEDYTLPKTAEDKMNKTIKSIVKYLGKKFGKFKKNNKKKSHNQLVILVNCKNLLANDIASYLKNNYDAEIIDLSEHTQPNSAIIDVEKLKILYDNPAFDWDLAAMEEYCWATITAFQTDAKMKTALEDSSKSNKKYYLDNQLKFSITLSKDNKKKYPVNLNKKANGTKLKKYKKAAKKREKDFQSIDEKIKKAEEAGKQAKKEKNEKAAAAAKDVVIKQKKARKQVKDIPSDLKEEAIYGYQIKRFEANAKKTKTFNQKIAKFHKGVDLKTKNIYDLLPWHHFNAKYKNTPLPDHINVTNLREIFYDLISMDAQIKQRRINQIIIICSGLGLLFFSIYSDFPFEMLDMDPLKPFIALFVLFMFIAFMVEIIFVKKGGVHSEYLEFRALAEGMRVQCYWYALHINESVGINYIVKFDKDIQWVKLAFNAWYLLDFSKKQKIKNQLLTKEEFNIIKSEWLGTKGATDDNGTKTYLPKELLQELKDLPNTLKSNPDINALRNALGDTKPGGQFGFYQKRSGQHGKRGSFYDNAKKWLFIAWGVFYVALFISLLSPKIVDEPLIFLMGFVNILTMGLTCASSIMADNELASKYTYCLFMTKKALEDYDRAINNYENTKDEQKVKDVFIRFGSEALEENAEWLMIKNSCEPEVPNG